MDHGKHVAIEVPAALTVKDCWALVDKAEETQLHCMMLENCCYDFFELATLNMQFRQGLLEKLFIPKALISTTWEARSLKAIINIGAWNTVNTIPNPYPTHGLGSVAQILGNQPGRPDGLPVICFDQPVRPGSLGEGNLKDDERITQSERYALGI